MPTHVPGQMVPGPIVVDPRLLTPVALPRTMRWSIGDLIKVLMAVGVVAAAGLALGWNYGGGVEPTFAARSEFIYFLQDSLPDGVLREDRRILTQLVTLESETVVAPVATEFDTTVPDLRDLINTEVVELSEVIRLDIEHADPDYALAVNEAILDQYTMIADTTIRRDDDQPLRERRAELLSELADVDSEVEAIAEAELADVALELREESLNREISIASARTERLSAISDGLLTETSPVDDVGALEAELTNARRQLVGLENDLLSIRIERAALQRTIAQQLASEVPFSAASNQEREVRLGVQEDSVQLEIDTIAERIRRLEGAIAQSRLDTPVSADGAPVDDELTEAEVLVADLESQLLDVRTQRAELAQSTSLRPSLTRTMERLEQDLSVIEDQLAASSITEETPSPIEVLTEPTILAEPVGNPKLQWAAIGFIASLPVAVIVGALVRSRQRRRK